MYRRYELNGYTSSCDIQWVGVRCDFPINIRSRGSELTPSYLFGRMGPHRWCQVRCVHALACPEETLVGNEMLCTTRPRDDTLLQTPDPPMPAPYTPTHEQGPDVAHGIVLWPEYGSDDLDKPRSRTVHLVQWGRACFPTHRHRDTQQLSRVQLV